MSPDTRVHESRPLAGYASPLKLREYDARDQGAWEEFLTRMPGATFFHRPGWARVIETTLGHKGHYRAAWRNGRIVGLLPLVHVQSRLFGNALISTAFTTGGGILAEDEETATALARAAAQLGSELDVGHVELRQDTALELDGWEDKPGLYYGFARDLAASDDAELKAIPRKKRADLRKALDDARLTINGAASVEAFYAIYAESLRNLGTPVLPRRFYAALKQEFGDAVELSTVAGPAGDVAALMTFFFKDRALPYFGGATPKARGLHAYDLMYFRLMQRARARGMRRFDFGRSKRGTGSFDYKTYWGFAPEPLAYRYRRVAAGVLPEINPLNPKYRMQIALWRRLPLFAANAIGPLIARQIG